MDEDELMPEEAEVNAQNSEGRKHRILKPGESFGNYRVVKCLCAGLIINYYHMQHIRDLQDVTIGIFHHRAAKDAKFIKRLQALQKTLKGFDHEGIPKIRDCREIDEQTCLFLGPIEGQTLSQYFAAHATPGGHGLEGETATRILAHLLGLLGYAHTQGLDHRDIDTDMIFIQEDGSIRLLGLGVKAALGTALFEAIVSASVSPLDSSKVPGRLSSFDVMSPECKEGVREDSRVDLYCVGVIGYWLLTAHKPAGANLQMPTSLVEGLSAKWDEFLQRLLERNKDERFQSCRQALLALKDTDSLPESERAGLIQGQIDRIPVPKSILSRGELAIRVYRLSLIGLIGITLTALAAFILDTVFTEETTDDQVVAQLVDVGQAPQLIIEVQPPVSKIEFTGYGESFITKGGRLELRVAPGKYQLLASAPDYKQQIEALEINPGEQDAPQRISFNLVPVWTDIAIRTEPGAMVAVIDSRGEEVELGAADEAGNFLLKKEAFTDANKQVIVKKEGYTPAVLQGQALNFAEVREIDAPLTLLPASLSVITSPPGARITIDGVDIGPSPLVLEGVTPKDQSVLVAQLEGYRSIVRHVKLGPGQELAVDFGELTPKSAELQIEASFEGLNAEESKPLLAQTEVVLGDQRYPIGDPALKSIPEGKYTVELEHPLYVSPPKELVLADRDVREVSFTLTPRPGEVKLVLPGKLKPRILLNGQEIKWEGDTVALPAYTAVEFELQAKNYLTMARNFTLQPKEKVIWEVKPVPIPGPKKAEDWVVPYLGLKLAWIPAGSFSMGSPMQEEGRLPEEGNRTEVTFTQGFWAGIYEVTQASYYTIVGQRPSSFSGAKLPADTVTWEQANAFCQMLTQREREAGRLPEGYVYRLPTEAEWEYVARGGTTTPFHFGKTADTSFGNFRGFYPRALEDSQRATRSYGTEQVGSYPPNAFGLYDIHGNVSEWTMDAYNARLPGGRLTDPAPRTGGKRYALRGGSWEDFAVRVRTAARTDARMDIESNSIGFRLFLAPEK